MALLARPMFIVLEGLDGAGKTTCARMLADFLDAQSMTTPSPEVREHRDAIVGSFAGNQEAAHLFYLSTVVAASSQVGQVLASGRSVVMDRYFLSTQAYAEFRGSNLQLDYLGSRLAAADLTVYLDAPAAVRAQRLSGRNPTAADLETLPAGACERLRRLHLNRSASPVVGNWLEVDNAGGDPERAAMRIADVARFLSHMGAQACA
jgi:dTMP kinase